MGIVQDIIESLKEDAPTREVRVGLFWTAVVSRGCGLAFTLVGKVRNRLRPPVAEAGQLAGRSALELARYALRPEPLAASIGMAAINSLIPVDERCCRELNAADFLVERGKGKRVALVGHFPFVPRLREAAEVLWVIERQPLEGDVPEGRAEEVIPQADVVAITGSAFVNQTVEGLLALPRKGALVMVLGPTTPMSPVLFDYGVDVVSGTMVVDAEAVLRLVSQGGTFRQMRGIRLLTMIRSGRL